MDWLLIGGLAGVALVLWAISWFLKTASKQREENAANADQLLDDVFNGDPVVSCDAGFTDLPYETVVKGAITRGYDLYSEGSRNSYGMQKLIFKKADQSDAPSQPG